MLDARIQFIANELERAMWFRMSDRQAELLKQHEGAVNTAEKLVAELEAIFKEQIENSRSTGA